MKKLQKIKNKIINTASKTKHTLCEFVATNPYAHLMRLNKLIGTHLAFLPAMWSVAFIAPGFLHILFYSLIFYVAAMMVRGAGCVINDLWDIEFDKKVERTKNRPLANKEISKNQALLFAASLLIFPVLVLAFLPYHSIVTALIAIVMIIIYPSMKRITNFPQVFLGFTFNLGVLIAWFAIDPRISLTPFVLYIATVMWTISYDTIYGHQDRKDDLKVGVKSLSIYLGDKTAEICWKMYLSTAILLMIIGLIMHMNLLFYFIAATGIYQLYWQTETLDIENPKNCGKRFESNVYFGLIILFAILVGRI